MAITRLLAQMTVSDLGPALAWYERFFGTRPDARPMEGLAEWHLADSFGIQVWADAERCGDSAMVLDESDLDARLGQLDRAAITYDGPHDVTESRVAFVQDPDGNQIVLSGRFADPPAGAGR